MYINNKNEITKNLISDNKNSNLFPTKQSENSSNFLTKVQTEFKNENSEQDFKNKREENSLFKNIIPEKKVENNAFKNIIPEKKEENSLFKNIIPEKKVENNAFKNIIPEKKEENSLFKNIIPEKKEENNAFKNIIPEKKEENNSILNNKKKEESIKADRTDKNKPDTGLFNNLFVNKLSNENLVDKNAEKDKENVSLFKLEEENKKQSSNVNKNDLFNLNALSLDKPFTNKQNAQEKPQSNFFNINNNITTPPSKETKLQEENKFSFGKNDQKTTEIKNPLILNNNAFSDVNDSKNFFGKNSNSLLTSNSNSIFSNPEKIANDNEHKQAIVFGSKSNLASAFSNPYAEKKPSLNLANSSSAFNLNNQTSNVANQSNQPFVKSSIVSGGFQNFTNKTSGFSSGTGGQNTGFFNNQGNQNSTFFVNQNTNNSGVVNVSNQSINNTGFYANQSNQNMNSTSANQSNQTQTNKGFFVKNKDDVDFF